MTESPIDYLAYGVRLDNGSRDEVPPNLWQAITLQQRPPARLAYAGDTSKFLEEAIEFEAAASDDGDTVVTATIDGVDLEHEGTASPDPEWSTSGETVPARWPGQSGTYAIGASAFPTGDRVWMRLHTVLLSYVADEVSDFAAVGSVWFGHEQYSDVVQDYKRGPAVDLTLLGPGYPVSAWHVATLGIDASNAITARDLQSVCVPLFGAVSVE